jgi:hypothetical protein
MKQQRGVAWKGRQEGIISWRRGSWRTPWPSSLAVGLLAVTLGPWTITVLAQESVQPSDGRRPTPGF